MLIDRIIESMTTNETTFFRDLQPFEALWGDVIPRLLHANRGHRQLVVWSAGCSTGQEAYSLAMMLQEHFPQLADWSVRIIGTDINESVLVEARRGRYSSLAVSRGLPSHLLLRHFTPEQDMWALCDEVKCAVEFRRMNLLHSWPLLPTCDLVLMRNVLIYFDSETRLGLLRRALQKLQPAGYLLLGGAESIRAQDLKCRRHQVGQSIFYQRCEWEAG